MLQTSLGAQKDVSSEDGLNQRSNVTAVYLPEREQGAVKDSFCFQVERKRSRQNVTACPPYKNKNVGPDSPFQLGSKPWEVAEGLWSGNTGRLIGSVTDPSTANQSTWARPGQRAACWGYIPTMDSPQKVTPARLPLFLGSRVVNQGLLWETSCLLGLCPSGCRTNAATTITTSL